MTGKIFRAIVSVAVIILIASTAVITGCMYSYFGGVHEQQLSNELDLAAAGTEQGGESYLAQVRSDNFRLTWIAADGTVLYDTHANASEMTNHAEREEVAGALSYGRAASSRYSSTLLERLMYEAVRLSDGTVLRIAASRATVGAIVIGMLQPILFVVIAAAVVSGIFASRMAKRIVGPLNRLDLEHPLENDVYPEVSPLLTRLHQQRVQIDDQLASLRRRADEFEQITGSMTEGLVLLDAKGSVLSINPAACKIFQTNPGCVGSDFVAVNRSRDTIAAVSQAFEQGHSEIRISRGGHEYQVDFSRIETGGEAVGMAVLAFDVTEQAFAERNRREFTANVSHELKTPLQSIVGSAELIENGLVKQEDMPRFIGRIRQEALRLVLLIEDIIRLSQLDEAEEMEKERVSLYDMSEEVVAALQPNAAARAITLSVEGDRGEFDAVPRLIHEIVYNLCDNAIKYNVDGGKVLLRITDGGNSVKLTVSDTGIGIPPQHQDRVFERFYRVDKSHSKQSGGTGLGLSIVKHAVQYHHGSVSLESETGKGTTVTVIFPKLVNVAGD